MSKYTKVLLNIAHVSILKAVATKPDLDADDIIRMTGISQAKVYRDRKTLTDVGLITATGIRTGAGYKKTTYRSKYNKISLVMYKDQTRSDLKIL